MTLLRVIDLKQYEYCPRILYYYYCLPDIRPLTYKMEAGLAAQDEEEVRAARRSLRLYGLRRGECETNIYLESPRLGLRGQVDLVIQTDDNKQGQLELIPVDYKLSTGQPGRHFHLQLLAYGLMLEEARGIPARRGFIYTIPQRRAIEVSFTPALRRTFDQALATMTHLVTQELMPEPTKQQSKCLSCEFRRFCNDVL